MYTSQYKSGWKRKECKLKMSVSLLFPLKCVCQLDLAVTQMSMRDKNKPSPQASAASPHGQVYPLSNSHVHPHSLCRYSDSLGHSNRDDLFDTAGGKSRPCVCFENQRPLHGQKANEKTATKGRAVIMLLFLA